jgi:hypothetical protein
VNEDETMSRREVRIVAALIGYFNTLDPDQSIRDADDFTAKLFGDKPLGPLIQRAPVHAPPAHHGL